MLAAVVREMTILERPIYESCIESLNETFIFVQTFVQTKPLLSCAENLSYITKPLIQCV